MHIPAHSTLDPSPEILPGMVPPNMATASDDLGRFEGEGGKPAMTPAEQAARRCAERQVRWQRGVDQVRALGAAACTRSERLAAQIRAEPLKATGIALTLGWVIGRIWPRR